MHCIQSMRTPIQALKHAYTHPSFEACVHPSKLCFWTSHLAHNVAACVLMRTKSKTFFTCVLPRTSSTPAGKDPPTFPRTSTTNACKPEEYVVSHVLDVSEPATKIFVCVCVCACICICTCTCMCGGMYVNREMSEVC
jgi:hypothetical protein